MAIKPIQANFGTITGLELMLGLAVWVLIALCSDIYDQKALITARDSMKTSVKTILLTSSPTATTTSKA